MEKSDKEPDSARHGRFVRRSTRARAPVARLSPQWVLGPGEEGEGVVEQEAGEEGGGTEEDLRRSHRRRATVQRYSPKLEPARGHYLFPGGRGSPPVSRRRDSQGGTKRDLDMFLDGNGLRRNPDGNSGQVGNLHNYVRHKTFSKQSAESDDDSEGTGFELLGLDGMGGGLYGNPTTGQKLNSYPLTAAGHGAYKGSSGAGSVGSEGKGIGAEITPLSVDPSLTFDQARTPNLRLLLLYRFSLLIKCYFQQASRVCQRFYL